MVDNSGLPLPSIPVEIRLFEYEENDKAVDVETVRQLWDKQVSENIELNSPAFVEKVGRVDGSRFLSTDGDGKISVALIAPSLFSAHVIVAARTISGQAIPDLISFAQVKTSSTEDAGKLTLESNFENNIIPAGKNADFWIVLRDQTGAIVTGYEGPALFNLEAQKPSDAWAGLSSVDFRSGFTCNFIAGRCAVAGGPFNFAKAEKLNISVQGLKPATSKVTTTIEILKGVTPAQVIAADKMGGPDANAQPLRGITMKAGESLSLAAAWIDEGGNYLGDATDTRWLASSQTFQQFLPADARTGFPFEPNITGVFELKLNSVAARESSTIPVEVQAGSQAGWKVVTQNNGVETAGSCFRVTVSAVDAAGNTIPNVEGETLGLLEIAGAVATPPLVNDVAHFTRLGLRIASNEAASRINLRFGTGSSVEQVCLFDATDVSPKIVFSANGLSGETPVTVLKGQPAAVRLSRENTGDSAANACSTPLSPDNLGKPCITFNADDMMLPTPNPTQLYAALTDVAGNFVSNTEARWQITGPLGELKSDGTPKFAIIDTITAEQRLITTLSGKGTFLVTPASGEISPQRFAYEVKHGIPASAQVTTLEGGRQKTTQPFRVKATLLDKWNNVATTFTGSLNAQVSLEKAPFSPNGAESVAAFSWNMNFAAGGGELVSSETLLLPCACNPEIQPSAGLGCRNQSANPAGYLLVTEDPSDPEKNTYQCSKVELNIAGLGSFFSEPLTVSPDALAQLKLRDRAGGLGEDISQLYSDTTPLEQEIFKPLTLYVAGYDSLGNFGGEASSDSSWQWTSEGMATAPLPEFQSRSASPSLVSNVTGDGRLSSVAVGNAGVSIESPTIRFKSSRAVRYAIVTNNTDANTGVTTEVAGEPFQILLKAIDPSGNVDPNFSGDRTFTWTAISDPSWDDTLPVLPDGQGFSCTFASGVCLLPTPMENPDGWVISNSLRASILNVVEDTPADQLPVGSERLEGTFASTLFVTAGNPYRLIYTDKVGGPSSGAKVTVAAGRHLQMTTDETFSHFLAVADKAGNYLSELNAAKVEGDATYVTPYVTTATTNGGTRIQFKPELKTPRPDISQDPEPVQLLVSSNTDATLQTLEIQISVHHGRPQKALTRLLKKGQSGNYDEPADTALVAGECYSVDVLVTDATDNAIDTLAGTALSKTGVRNFSVSQDYLNLNGGFYKYNETSGMFTGFRFGTSDSSFSGSEYTVRSRKVSASNSVFQAGGFTNWEHIERGKLTSSEALFFCVGDLQATPEVLITLLSGLSYRDKENVPQLAAAVSGTSQTHSVVAGPPAALTFFMNFVDGNGAVKSVDIGGQSRSEMRLCTYGPYWGNGGYVTGSVVLAPTTANTPPIVKFSEDYQNCLAMIVDLGGLNLSAKVTDIAGNILSQTPSGTWSFVDYSTGSGQVDGTQFVQTATSFHDPLRRAGVFTIEYTETTTGLKATVVAKVKAGRASNFNLSVSPTVAATQAFNGWMSFVDAWGNPYCDGHYIPNLTGGFGWDPLTQSSTVHIAVPYKIEWVGTPPPTTIKVPVGRPLTSDNSPLMRNATCALGNLAGSGYFGSLQIPKTGNYTLQFSSNQLFNKQGVAGSLSKIADINVLPGPVVRANVEYVNAPSGLAGVPTQGGQALPAAYVPGETEPAPLEIKSFWFESASATSNVGVALYMSGYDQEDNFNKALPSVVTSVADPELDEEFEYPIQETYVRSRCNNLTLSVCSFSQLKEQTTADKIHVLVGQRAGVSTLEIRPTIAASSAVFRFKVRTVVGPDWQKQLIGTEKDYSEVVLPEGKTIEQIESGSTNVMVGSKLRFKLRVVDYNFNTYASESGPKFVNFGLRSTVKSTKEGYENTVPTSGEYNFSNGVSSATFTSQIYTAGVNSVTAKLQEGIRTDYIRFSGSGIIEAKPFHHYGTITRGSGAGGAYRPSSKFTDTFSTLIELRDEYGNALSPDKGPQLPVQLTIVREDGTTTAGPLCRQECPPMGWESGVLDSSTQDITLSALENQTEIADLKYPQAGKFKIFVSDGQSTEPDLNVKLRASSTIFMESSFDVIAGFQLTHIDANPSTQALSVNAGQQTAFTAKVVDLYGGAVSGIDGVLNNVNFSWSSVAAAAPDGTAAILPSVLNFAGGRAQVQARFYKAETIAQNTLTLSGTTGSNQTLSTSYGGELVVLPGAINEYRVQTCQPSQPNTCDTSKKIFKAEKSDAGFFDIKIETFDEWMNPRSGDSGVSLVATKITGPGSNVSGFLSSTGANEDTAQDTTNFNLASNNGSKVFSQLWYPIGHTVELDLNNASVSLAEKPQLEFQYTEKSITGYKLDFSSNSIVSGDNNLTLTITAQDKAKNTISTLDTELNSRQFIISGPLQSPNGNVPKINGTMNALAYNSWPFVNGVATQNMSLYKAQIINTEGFLITDNIGIRGKNVQSPIVVLEGSVSQFRFRQSGYSNIPQQTAGQSFTLLATTTDNYGNLSDVDCAAGLGLGAMSPSPGGWGGAETPATIPAAQKNRTGRIHLRKCPTDSIRNTELAIHRLFCCQNSLVNSGCARCCQSYGAYAKQQRSRYQRSRYHGSRRRG